MSGTQHSEHSSDKGSDPSHTEGHEDSAHHAHEGHPSHGVPPSFANPLGEAPMDDSEPSATDGALVEALEVAGVAGPQVLEKAETGGEHEGQVLDSASGLPALMEASDGEPVTPTTKVTVLSADKWNEDYKVRVETLQQEIEELNIRLDQITAHKA